MFPNVQLSKRSKMVLLFVAAIVIATGIGLFMGFSATQEVPEFYRQAKAKAATRTPRQLEQIGTGFGRRLTELADEAYSGGSRSGGDVPATPSTETRWRELYREDELNAWLATELPRQFPRLLPPGVKDPQVKISNGRAQLGFQYQQGNLQGVVSLDLEVGRTSRESEFTFRIQNVSMGSLPLPVSQVLALITETGDRATGSPNSESDFVQWTQKGDDPVAIIQLPSISRRSVTLLESFELRDGEVEVGVMRRASAR